MVYKIIFNGVLIFEFSQMADIRFWRHSKPFETLRL